MPDEAKPERRSIELVQYDFSHEELRLLGEQMAREAQMVYDLRDQKKVTAAQATLAIDEAEGRVSALARKINARHEMRDAECTAIMNSPRSGTKSIVRVDTGEVVREEPMTMEELQEKFAFDSPGEDSESQPRKKRKDVN
jgi:hypothetical protein